MKKMINRLALVGFLSLFMMVDTVSASSEVPYKTAKNYFVRNDYPDKEIHVLKITSQQKFSDIFGMAPLMSKDGKPTDIDFAKKYVIALINNSSNNVSGLDIKSLTKNGGELSLIYSIEECEPRSFTSRYFTLLIVDKKYDGKIYANRIGAGNQPLTGADMDEHGCKPSTGYTWSIIKNKCIRVFEEGGKVLNGKIGNVGLIFSSNKKEAELIGFRHGSYSQNVVLKNVTKIKVWKSGNISLSLEKGVYVLRDKKTELARGN